MLRIGAVIALALGMWGTREVRLRAFDMHLKSQRYEDIYYIPPAEWLPVMSLGFRTALADLLWCKSLVYFGEEIVHGGHVKSVFEYTDAIVTLDPDFRAAYIWAPTAAIYRPGSVALEDGLRGAEYIRRATERWPDDADLAWEYGSLLAFELAPITKDPEQKRQLRTKAAVYLQQASRAGAGPAWLALNSANLLEKLGKNEQAIKHLEEVYATVQDEATKAEIERRLAAMRSQSYAEAMRATNEAFRRDHLGSFPYISESLFLFVGKKDRQARIDLLERRFAPEDLVMTDLDDDNAR